MQRLQVCANCNEACASEGRKGWLHPANSQDQKVSIAPQVGCKAKRRIQSTSGRSGSPVSPARLCAASINLLTSTDQPQAFGATNSAPTGHPSTRTRCRILAALDTVSSQDTDDAGNFIRSREPLGILTGSECPGSQSVNMRESRIAACAPSVCSDCDRGGSFAMQCPSERTRYTGIDCATKNRHSRRSASVLRSANLRTAQGASKTHPHRRGQPTSSIPAKK